MEHGHLMPLWKIEIQNGHKMEGVIIGNSPKREVGTEKM